VSPLSTSRFQRHRDRWITPVVVMRFSFLSFMRNRDLHTAATLAFYGMFALIPLCLAVLFLLSQYFVSSQRASRAVENLIIQIVPSTTGHSREVFSCGAEDHRLYRPHSSALVRRPPGQHDPHRFHQRFKTERNVGFFREKLIDFLTVLILLLLFIGLVGGQILYATALAIIWPRRAGSWSAERRGPRWQEPCSLHFFHGLLPGPSRVVERPRERDFHRRALFRRTTAFRGVFAVQSRLRICIRLSQAVFVLSCGFTTPLP